MRILAIANHLGARGGLERTQLTMCRALSERGHSVDLVYVSEGDFTDDWRRFAVSMHRIGATLPTSHALLTSSVDVLGAIRTAQRLAPDVIYVFRYLDVPLAVATSKLTGAPVVLHLCLPQPNSMLYAVKRSLASVSLTLAVSFDTAANWRNTPLPTDSTMVVHTGIDMDVYRPATDAARQATRHELGIGEDESMALYAGRISPEKGVDVLLSACRSVAAAHPDLRLVVVGGPSLGVDPTEAARYIASLRALAGTLDVIWLDTRRDVVPLIQATDVALAPSTWPEPFSRSVIEPLACGVPVLASRVGGNPEILTGWLDEYLMPPGDAAALAAGIERAHRWRRTDPGRAGAFRASVVERLSLAREVDTVEANLAAIARRPAPVPVSVGG